MSFNSYGAARNYGVAWKTGAGAPSLHQQGVAYYNADPIEVTGVPMTDEDAAAAWASLSTTDKLLAGLLYFGPLLIVVGAVGGGVYLYTRKR